MREYGKIFVAVLLLAFLVRGAKGAASAEMAFADSPGGGGREWELLVVHVDMPAGGGSVSVRDVRGGLEVSRTLEGAAMEGGQGRILMPLPLLAMADLPTGSWPVEIVVRSDGTVVSRGVVEVRRGAGGGGAFRVVKGNGDAGGELAWGQVSLGGAVFAGVSDEEILFGPTMLFAGCDAVVVSERVLKGLTAARIAGLLGAGVRLVSRSDPAAVAGDGAVGKLEWTHVEGEGGFWITAVSGYARPRVVEDGIARARTMEVAAVPGRGTIAEVLMVPVMGMVVLLLARGLFRSRVWVLVAMFLGMAGLAVVAVLVVRWSASSALEEVAWASSRGGGQGSSLAITERFTATSALFGQRVKVVADAENLVYPVSISARQYFGLQDAVLSLDGLSDDGLRKVARLEMTEKPRGMAVYAERSAALIAGGTELAHGAWIEGGYVTPTTLENGELSGGSAMIFSQWANAHAESKSALLTWYELRFEGSHRYFMKEPADGPGGEPLTFVDFGVAGSASRP